MKYLPLIILLLFQFSTYGQNDRNALIRAAVERQMQQYPQSTLQDLYKNFFQDRFGPGHLIADTVSAKENLQKELQTKDALEGPLYEQTGYSGNFYRVNLRVIRDGMVNVETFYRIFVQSAGKITPVNIAEWATEWSYINNVIDKMNLSLNHYAQDSVKLKTLLQSGQYVVHHSPEYDNAYRPHYRLIAKDIFIQELLPLLIQQK